MGIILRGGLAVSFLLASACATTSKPQPAAQGAVEPAVDESLKAEIKESEVSSEDVERNVEKPYKSAYGDIPMDDNEHVQKWVRYFTGKGRRHMDNYLSRSSRYLPMMKNVLRENGLPEDLVYIALIESGFSPRAHSKANAVGYWQFIRSTGKRFGLQIDTFIDERRDPVLSTRAAAEYFKALYNMQGSWHLAMASYNVGEFRVKRAVTRYQTRDFWQLIKKRRALPAETRNYVPKFIAAAMIAKSPEKYGFTEIGFQDPLSYDTVALQSPISLSKLASNLSVDLDEMKLLNPKFRTDFVPISRGSETVVRIPVGRANDALAALSMSVTSQPRVLQSEHFYYRIRRGDNLSTIAKRHRTTVSQLRRLNGLSNRALLRPGRTLKVPDQGGDPVQYVMEEDARPSRARLAVPALDTREVEYHVVRRGDNLSTIARRYGLSVSDLLQLNEIKMRSVLRQGQKIRVRAPAEPKSTKLKGRSDVAKRTARGPARTKSIRQELPAKVRKSHAMAGVANRAARRHVVKRGETLYEVSKKYGVTLNQLARTNNIKISTKVMAGQRLVIPD